jgi:quercetin dioxygenase-like cupin family protein
MDTHGLSRILDRVTERSHGAVLDVLGPTVELLSAPSPNGDFSVMRGVLPPRGIVPLHSHDDAEAFLVLSGQKQALVQGDRGLEWHRVGAGDYVEVESGTPHAWRNDSDQPVVDLLITTERHGRFFQELARPAGTSGPPSPDDLARLAALAAKYGYWFATPEENAAVGFELPSPVAQDAGRGR